MENVVIEEMEMNRDEEHDMRVTALCILSVLFSMVLLCIFAYCCQQQKKRKQRNRDFPSLVLNEYDDDSSTPFILPSAYTPPPSYEPLPPAYEHLPSAPDLHA